MRKFYLLTLVSVSLFFAIPSLAQPCKEVIAYYPNWQWYDRAKLVQPSTIDYSKYSIINYSFFKPLVNGDIVETDSWADENLLFGQPDWQNGGYLPNTSLIDIAHNNNVKVLVSIGGWTLSDNFPGIAADSVKRSHFASECNRLLTTYNFDGIDLDWEYPGFADHNGTPADGVNFTLLVQEIRDSIDALGIETGKQYLLSSCFSASREKMQIIEWSNLIGELDMFNLMSYDFFGTWDAVSNHNSPLYPPAVGDSTFNIDSAFYQITQVHGVQPALVNIGLPFYGRSVTGCTGLHLPTSGAVDGSTFWEDEGMPTYYNIVNMMGQFTSHWDNQAQVPYLLGNSINTFVSYDNEQSIANKAQYVLNKGARGVIIWELTGDYVETSAGSGVIAGTPLADTLNAVLCSVVTWVDEFQQPEKNACRIYPNPATQSDILAIQLAKDVAESCRVEVLSCSGQKVYSRSLTNTSSINIPSLKKGIYFVWVISKNESHLCKLVIQ